MDNQDSQKIVQGALDTNLRLHAHKIELGQAEMLTDVLLNKFDDIEKRLNTYIAGASNGEVLRKSMQSYLSRLNSNPLIPLHFRLKVLKRFEDQLDLFTAEMTAAILNAHKIGIDMVQEKARTEKGYYPILVGMISDAIELAGRLMRDGLERYHSAGIITIRQVFDLIRLGMVMLPELTEESEKERRRFYIAIVRYELLRNLDFFSLTLEEQSMVMDELKHHIPVLEPHYLAKGAIKPAEVKGYSLFVTNLSRPHETAKVLPFAPDSSATDHLLVPMDDFIDKLVTSINRTESVLKDPLLQSKDIQIESSLQTTVVGGNAILDGLRTKSRVAARHEYGNAKVGLDWTLLGLMYAEIEEDLERSGSFSLGSDLSTLKGKIQEEVWSVLNISKNGLALERLGEGDLKVIVGDMVALNWKPHRGEPKFAFVRWLRCPRPGELQMGFEFYMQKHVVLRAGMLSVGDASEHRNWPVLMSFEEGNEHTVLFPDTNIFKGMVFHIQRNGRKDFFKVLGTQSEGPNYSICVVTSASELDTRNIDKASEEY